MEADPVAFFPSRRFAKGMKRLVAAARVGSLFWFLPSIPLMSFVLSRGFVPSRRLHMDDGRHDSEGAERTFLLADYKRDSGPAVAYAEQTGRAVVVDEQGRTRIVISIPREDLPGFTRTDC